MILPSLGLYFVVTISLDLHACGQSCLDFAILATGKDKQFSVYPTVSQSSHRSISHSIIHSFRLLSLTRTRVEGKEGSRGRRGRRGRRLQATTLHDSVVRFNENKLIFAWHLRLIVIHQGSCCCRLAEWLNGKDALFAFRIYMPAPFSFSFPSGLPTYKPLPGLVALPLSISALAWIDIQLRVWRFISPRQKAARSSRSEACGFHTRSTSCFDQRLHYVTTWIQVMVLLGTVDLVCIGMLVGRLEEPQKSRKSANSDWPSQESCGQAAAVKLPCDIQFTRKMLGISERHNCATLFYGEQSNMASKNRTRICNKSRAHFFKLNFEAVPTAIEAQFVLIKKLFMSVIHWKHCFNM